MTATDLPSLPLGRASIHPGDLVRVGPSKPGKRDAYTARLKRIREVQTCCPACAGTGRTATIEVDVCGPRGWATLRPDRLKPTKGSRT